MAITIMNIIINLYILLDYYFIDQRYNNTVVTIIYIEWSAFWLALTALSIPKLE